jgi:hypothetical protein
MSDRPVIAPEDCPEPVWHTTHRYCPVCSWTEDYGKPARSLTKVTARFFVTSIERFAYPQVSVKLTPAYSKKHNAAWAAATPSGSIQLTIGEDLPAAAWFEEMRVAKADIAITFEQSADPRDV